MNAKIKLTLVALATAGFLASCGGKGTPSMTRAEAEAVLDAMPAKATSPVTIKSVYQIKDVTTTTELDISNQDSLYLHILKKGEESKTVDGTTVTTKFDFDLWIYKGESEYILAVNDRVDESKKYYGGDAVAKVAITAKSAIMVNHAVNYSTYISNWLKDCDYALAVHNSEEGAKNAGATDISATFYAMEDESYSGDSVNFSAAMNARYSYDGGKTLKNEHLTYKWTNSLLEHWTNQESRNEETMSYGAITKNNPSVASDGYTQQEGVTGLAWATAQAAIASADLYAE